MWLSIAETARVLALSPSTIRRMVADGELGKERVEGSRTFCHVEAVRKYAKLHTAEGDRIHRRLMVQSHVLLIATNLSGEVMVKLKRATTRLTIALTVEPKKVSGLILLGIYQPRIVITPFDKWGTAELGEIREVAGRLVDANFFSSTRIWGTLTGRKEYL